MRRALIPIIATIIGCANHGKINPESKKVDLNIDSVFVVSVKSSDVKLEILEHFNDDFKLDTGKTPESFLADLFNDKFLDGLKTWIYPHPFISNMKTNTDDSCTNFIGEIDADKHNKELLKFDIPRHSYLSAYGIKARYILVLNNLVFSLETRHGFSGGKLTSPDFIGVTLNYILWDYQTNSYVGYGRAKGFSGAQWDFTRDEWELSIEKSALNVSNLLNLDLFINSPRKNAR